MNQEKEVLDRFLEAQDRLVFQAADLSLGTIANMVDRDAINVQPHYQRRERWSIHKQSALIESFLMNVPVPPVYLSEDEFGRYSVVDGRQRITAIHRFMSDELKLAGLDSFREVEGRIYGQLPPDLQNTLDVRPYLRVITLLKQSDPMLKFEVFTRLNRGGERMEAQEIRNVAYRGELNELIYELAKSPFLLQQLKIRNERSPAYRVMADPEFVLRFFTLEEGWQHFSGNYREEMNAFMRRYRHPEPAQLQKMRSQFESVIGTCEGVWGANAFKRPVGNGWRDQMLAGMYDAQMTAVSRISEDRRIKLIDDRQRIVQGTRELFQDPEFEVAVRQGTNTPSRVVYRIERMTELLG